MQLVAVGGMEPPAGRDPNTLNNAKDALWQAVVTADPANYVRGQYDGYRDDRRRGGGLDDGDVRGAAPGHRQLALVRRAVLHPYRQDASRDADRVPAGLQGAAAAGPARAGRAPPGGQPAHDQARPDHRHPLRPGGQAGREATAGADRPGDGVRRRRAARARRRTRCCCTPRWSATAPASPGRTASRRRGGSCSRCSTRRRRSTRTSRGPGGRPRPTGSSPTSAAGANRGWRHDDDPRRATRWTSAAVGMTSPFTPIADYAFLSDCHTGALVAPDGSVDWLCVPAFDSPSIFGSLVDREARQLPLRAVRHRPSRLARLRARARTCWRRRGAPGPAGWSCGTR